MAHILGFLLALLFAAPASAQCIGGLLADGSNPCPDAATFRAAIGAGSGSGSGTVTSVTFTGDGTVLSSTPSSAVTTSGTVTGTLNTQSANTLLSGPTTGSPAAPTFRALVAADIPTGTKTKTFNIIIDGGGSAITTGAKPAFEVGGGCTITAWRVLSDQSGSIVVDIKKATYSGLPTFSSIAASAKPTLSTAQKAENTTLTGWTTAVAAGDWIQPVVDSATTVTYATISITCVGS